VKALPANPIIFPLDVPSLDAALVWVERLARHVGLFKVGLELFSAEGPDAVRRIQRAGGRVFLDVKLHDIPATVAGAGGSLRELEPAMVTVHAQGGKAMLEAAVGAFSAETCVLAVTRLTSLAASIDEVTDAARMAREAGCGGVVCSGLEARAVRDAVGPELVIVCPGVRPRGADEDDQVRVVTPEAAVEAGATYLVVGRPIRNAEDPVAAADGIASAARSAR
jgi:orotidine-5'-phosphate decarboxylase